MPAQITAPFFKCLIKPIDGDWVETSRIVPMSFRKALRGLGAGQFRILAYVEDETKRSIPSEIMIKDNRITDGNDIVWRGMVTSVTMDKFSGEDNDIGQLFAEEYGAGIHHYPILYTEATPNFNPYYDNVQYGNYDGGNFRTGNYIENEGMVDGYTIRNGVGTNWSFYNTEKNEWDIFTSSDYDEIVKYVWTRERILRYLISNSPHISDIIFPWGDGEAGNNYDWFTSWEVDEVPNFEMESIQDALNYLVKEPFDWYFDYNAGDDPVVVIINKITTAMPSVTKATAKVLNIEIPKNDTAIFNYSVQADEVYDRVIVRGNRISWTGTLTFWGSQYSDKVLLPDWTEDEEKSWLQGTIIGLEENQNDNPILNEIVRKTLDNVYQKFKFKDNTPMIGFYSGNYGSGAEVATQKEEFFFQDFIGIDLVTRKKGSFPGIDEETGESIMVEKFLPDEEQPDNVGDKDVFLDEPIFNNDNMDPNPLARQWDSELPFTRFSRSKSDVDRIQMSLEKDRWSEPFLVSQHVRLEEPANGLIHFYDRTFPLGVASSVEISFHDNGVWIRRENPEVDISQVDELFRLELNGPNQNFDKPALNLEDIDNLELNPATNTDGTLEGWSNYQKWLLTVSGRSKQRLEAYRWRRGDDGKSISGQTGGGVLKDKIIDLDIDVCIVHPNTVRNVTAHKSGVTGMEPSDFESWDERSRTNTENGLIRFPPFMRGNLGGSQTSKSAGPGKRTPHIIIDGRSQLLQMLDLYSSLLLQPRGRLNLSLAIDKQYEDITKLGAYIGTVKDGSNTHTVNSVVASVEYIIETGPPRINIQTEVANEPIITASFNESRAANNERPYAHIRHKVPALMAYRSRDLREEQ